MLLQCSLRAPCKGRRLSAPWVVIILDFSANFDRNHAFKRHVQSHMLRTLSQTPTKCVSTESRLCHFWGTWSSKSVRLHVCDIKHWRVTILDGIQMHTGIAVGGVTAVTASVCQRPLVIREECLPDSEWEGGFFSSGWTGICGIGLRHDTSIHWLSLVGLRPSKDDVTNTSTTTICL